MIDVLQLSLETLFRRSRAFVLEETISSSGFIVNTFGEIPLDGLFCEALGLEDVQDLDLVLSTRERPARSETLSDIAGRRCGIGGVCVGRSLCGVCGVFSWVLCRWRLLLLIDLSSSHPDVLEDATDRNSPLRIHGEHLLDQILRLCRCRRQSQVEEKERRSRSETNEKVRKGGRSRERTKEKKKKVKEGRRKTNQERESQEVRIHIL